MDIIQIINIYLIILHKKMSHGGIEPPKKKEIKYAKTYQARESFILQIVQLVAARYVYACEV